MTITKLGAVITVAAMLSACANSGIGPKEAIGTATGAALGGWAGSTIGDGSGQLAATAAGVFIGGLIGNQIGRSMDQTDQLMAEQAQYNALERYPDGQSAGWQNPNNGNSGYTVPTNTYQNSTGTYCRQYQTTVVIDGRAETAVGTACRQPDGTWRMTS
jgi:surface antigen